MNRRLAVGRRARVWGGKRARQTGASLVHQGWCGCSSYLDQKRKGMLNRAGTPL
jgi:hypothetical protein